MKKIFVFILTLASMCAIFCLNANAMVYTDENQIAELNHNKEFMERYKSGEFGDEVYYMERSGGWLHASHTVIYKKDGVPMIAVYSQWERCKARELTDEEYNDLVSFITENKVDELKSWDTYMVMDGVWYTYMHFTGNSASYMYINNPGSVEGMDDEIYCLLTEKFENLIQNGDYEVGYNVDGAKVLTDNSTHLIESVWKNGDDFRIRVLDNDKSDYSKKVYRWFSYKDGIIGDEVDAPEGDYSGMDDIPVDNPEYIFYGNHNRSLFVKWNDSKVRILNLNVYLTYENKEPVLVKEGAYSKPVVAPGTDWIVCEKSVDGWQNPRKLVRINLLTGEEDEIDIPMSDSINPLGVLNGKILVGKTQNSIVEYYLYDCTNDSLEKVTGDFGCFYFINSRFLQESSVPGKYFALDNQHTVGIFDCANYSFEPILKTPLMIYDGDKMWVDEENELIYIVVNNELVALPFEIPLKSEKEVKIKIDGKRLLSYPAPYVKNSRAYLPVRSFCEKTGAEVIWNDKTQSVAVIRNDIAVIIKDGEKTFYTLNASEFKNDDSFFEELFASDPDLSEDESKFSEKHYFEQAPEITGGKFFAPVRAFCEMFDMKVEWNDEKQTVSVSCE